MTTKTVRGSNLFLLYLFATSVEFIALRLAHDTNVHKLVYIIAAANRFYTKCCNLLRLFNDQHFY